MLLVLWDHVVGGWTTTHGRSWLPLDAVRDWISNPLAIIQDFGFLGVTLFFLLSGYIISEVAVRESRRTFVIRRLLRIYPALIVSILIIIGIDAIRGLVGLAHGQTGVGQSLWAMSLLNYVRINQAPVNGVAWSLVIEMAFYVLVACFLGLLKRRPVVACFAELTVVAIVVATARDFPIDRFVVNWLLVGASVAYLPLLVIGQAIWLRNTQRASAFSATIVGVAAWGVFVFGLRRIHTQFLPGSNSYGVSAAFATLIVVVAVANESRIRLPRWLAAVSVISYSLYLIHGPLTVLVMDRLSSRLPFTVHLIVALAVLGVVAVLLWRLVEVPSQALARRLTRPPMPAAADDTTNTQ